MAENFTPKTSKMTKFRRRTKIVERNVRMCLPGCQCREGYVRESIYSNYCVSKNACVKKVTRFSEFSASFSMVGPPLFHPGPLKMARPPTIQHHQVFKQCDSNLNEVFTMCHGHCQPSCRKPSVFCHRMCVSGCGCRRGELRNDSGFCVVKEKC